MISIYFCGLTLDFRHNFYGGYEIAILTNLRMKNVQFV